MGGQFLRDYMNNYSCLILGGILTDLRASTSVGANFPSIQHKKNLLFLFYTSNFTKHPHQFICSTHLFNKIFIFLQFFIILSLTAPLSQTQQYQRSLHTSLHHHPPNQHHQGKSTHSIRETNTLELTPNQNLVNRRHQRSGLITSSIRNWHD